VNRRGVCYDVGRVLMGQNWRPVFDRAEVRRELQIIRDDLHANAVRICGEDPDRLLATGEEALALGLEAWLCPELWDHGPDETLAYLTAAARQAEQLRRHAPDPDRLVLSVGSELTLFMRGIVPGANLFERLQHPSFWQAVSSGAHNAPLEAFLAEAVDAVRQIFHGSLTYASVPLEAVAWDRFDIVSVDLYRDARIRDRFPGIARSYLRHGLPVVITETGCCTYRGAADAGGNGWAIVDLDVAQLGTRAPELNGDYLRDESEQAREVTELLTILDAAGVDGTFVMTFVAPLSPCSDDPRHDLDLAGYSLVKSYGNRLGDLATRFPTPFWDSDHQGTTYPDMPWEPKESFHAVADYYARAPEATPPSGPTTGATR
jgi:hypothetical protein